MTQNSRPLVTIALPTFNRASSYLRQALESALNQTYQDLDIIVSDNCSTDSTETLVRRFQDPRLRYFKHDTNIGANNNFNFCLSQARGEYFLLLLDDDLVDEDFVEVCMQSAGRATHIGMIRTGSRVIDSKGKVLFETPNRVVGRSLADFVHAWFAHKTSPYLCSTLFNTEALKAVGGFASKHNLWQDVIAELQLVASFGKIDIQDIKASFRRHPYQGTHAATVADWCKESLILLDLICDLVPQNQARVRTEGMLFFSRFNYRMANHVNSPMDRLIAYFTVFRAFNYRHIPPPIHDCFRNIPGYYRLESIQRKLRRALASFRR